MNSKCPGISYIPPLDLDKATPNFFSLYANAKKVSHITLWQQPKWITNCTSESTDWARLPLREISLLCSVKLKEEHIILSKTSGLCELQAQKPHSNPNHMPSLRKWGSVSFGDGEKKPKKLKTLQGMQSWQLSTRDRRATWNVFCPQIIAQILCKASSLAK